MAIGFAKDANLFESQDGQSATGIMNNLAGAGISDDIALFANNLRTVTEINYGSGEGNGNYTASAQAYYSPDEQYYTTGTPDSSLTYIVIPPATSGYVPFTNDSVIYTLNSIGEKVYHIVGDSNNTERFRLYEYDNVSKVKGALRNWSFFYNLEVKKFFRLDPVRFTNMTNLSKDRHTLNDESTTLTNPYDQPPVTTTGRRNPSQQATFLKERSPDEYLPSVQLAMDSFVFKESKNLVNYRKNVLTDLLTIDSAVSITNDADLVEGQSANNETMPGLYIYSQGESQRAFSGLYNPWVEATTSIGSQIGNRQTLATEASSQDAEVFKLVLEGSDPHIVTTNANDGVRTGPNVVVNDVFTHKAEIIVNGEQYYLLLSSNTDVFDT